MKLECYLYVPFQGQFRFGYDDSNNSSRVYLSDSDWDKRLEMPFNENGSRRITCRELVFNNLALKKWEPLVTATLDRWTSPHIHRRSLGDIIMMELNDDLSLTPTKEKPRLTVVLVRK